ncbi:hypothetical protein [Sinorhizobium medicae]|uniref:hypothetical protein n=1 Tax=Sinorhizobium medicae TaxID=110321 RepID=UPI002B1BE05A|nr:hypothetical protein [Sinorhizobium medicae]
MLLELFLADAGNFLVAVENDRAGRGRALIDRENISAHMPLLSTPFLKSDIRTTSIREKNECQTKTKRNFL